MSVDNREINKDALVEILGDEELVDDFLEFADKQDQKRIRQDIDAKTKEILDTELVDEYEEKLEQVSLLCRKAWSIACEELGYDERVYPSKY